MKEVKCRNIVSRKQREFECGRHLMKIEDNEIHIPCPNCGHYAIISVVNDQLLVVHVNKEGERKICNQKM